MEGHLAVAVVAAVAAVAMIACAERKKWRKKRKKGGEVGSVVEGSNPNSRRLRRCGCIATATKAPQGTGHSGHQRERLMCCARDGIHLHTALPRVVAAVVGVVDVVVREKERKREAFDPVVGATY